VGAGASLAPDARAIGQIRRAERAAELLCRGVSPLDAAAQVGYPDQPHLTRSLKRFVGRTPSQIAISARGGEPSFLFKTASLAWAHTSDAGHPVLRERTEQGDPVGKIVVAEDVSVDSVMQDPGEVGEIEVGGWTTSYWNDELAKLQTDLLFASDALLLGRVTYEGFAAAWTDVEHEQGPFADKMNTMPKYVASRTLTGMEWNATPIRRDVADEVAKLK